MSGSWPKPAEGRFAEQHLGDRLSALVDGELGHDSRERVLAHLATCARCKAEADAQRRLKNVFAEAAPPPPSESFLARLQGLPGGDPGGGGSRLGGGGLPGRLSGPASDAGVFGVGREDRFEFGYVPVGPHAPSPSADRGFRIHPVGRPDADRSASRGMRFAFVAAGAVSLAAVALGGVTSGFPGGTTVDARGGSGTESNMTPARSAGTAGTAGIAGTAGTGGASPPESARRRPAGPLLVQGTSPGASPVAPIMASAPLLPGASSAVTGQDPDVLHTLTTPVVAGAAVMSPLIRPLDASPITLTSWATAPEVATPGLLAASLADPSATP
ncbi:anti-sigma factor [Streptomyces sp. NPDC046805]|uniref:anti-sigma factor family protein n=1 Tax=Streptomyces sp. NPDC046805 TaxID=3155134 RepID=UPI0033F7BF54